MMNRWIEESETAQLWVPAVDVCETADEIVLHAELPGMKKSDIALQLNGDMLTISGERALLAAREGEHFHRIERQYGAWQRRFQIETPIEASAINAAYHEGVLTVRLPKQNQVRPRSIEIEIR